MSDRAGFIDTATWYDLWAAGIAVNEMCVRQGKLGTAKYVGEFWCP